MKRTLAVALALSVLSAPVLTAGAAFAQPGPGDHHGPGPIGGPPHDGPGPRPSWSDNHRGHRFDEHGGHFRYGRGERLPPNYRTYEVHDWRARHLRPPPRGYYWTRVDNDYVLAGVATGVIASIIAAQSY